MGMPSTDPAPCPVVNPKPQTPTPPFRGETIFPNVPARPYQNGPEYTDCGRKGLAVKPVKGGEPNHPLPSSPTMPGTEAGTENLASAARP